MKILFVIDQFYPDSNACTNCVLNIAQYLQGKGVSVHVLCSEPCKGGAHCSEYAGIRIYRYRNPELLGIHQILSRIKSQKKLLYISLIFQKARDRFYNKLFHLPYALSSFKNSFKALRNLYEKQKYEVVISVSAMFYTALAVGQLKKEKRDFIFLSYQVDPFATNHALDSFPKDKRLALEKRVYSSVDHAFVTPIMYWENIQNAVIYKEKMTAVELPILFISNLESDCTYFSNNRDQIHCVYAGMFYKHIREPHFLFSLVRKSQNIILHLFGINIFDIPNDFQDMLDKKVIVHQAVSPYELFVIYRSADVLINVGNTVKNQLPSKLIGYISTGKPIVNIYKISNCPTLECLDKYELKLNLFENNNTVNADAARFETFCRSVLSKCLDHKTILENYEEYTPGFVGEKLYSTIVTLTE